MGFATALTMAHNGFRTVCVDIVREKIDSINAGISHIFEPDITELLTQGLASGLLRASENLKEAVLETDVTFSGAILHRRLVELQIDDLLTVQFDFKPAPLAGDDISIPLTGGLGHILRRRRRPNHAATIVVARIGFAVCVEDLHFKTALDLARRITDSQKYAGVATLVDLEF